MTPYELLGKLKIGKVEEKGGFGKYILEPLPVGYGQTLGNSLRRTLLSSLPGAAVTYAKIEGASHQFSTLPGVKEDVIDLIQNFKKIRLRIHEFEVIGSGEVINKDLEIANLADKKTKLALELTAEPGFGYVPSEEHQTVKIGVIPIDSIFTPVLHVSYKVEQTRLGQATNLERLVLEVTTDKTVEPAEALKAAAGILVSYFKAVEVGESVEPLEDVAKKEGKKSKVSEADLITSVEDLGLSTRTSNALIKAKVKNLSDLSEKSSADTAKIKGLGEKGIGEIEDLLKKQGLR